MLYFKTDAKKNIEGVAFDLVEKAARYREPVVTEFNGILVFARRPITAENITLLSDFVRRAYYSEMEKWAATQHTGEQIPQNEGMLISLSELAGEGVSAYIRMHGKPPSSCWVNPPLFGEETIVEGITVKPGASYILKNELFITSFSTDT